MIAYVLQEGGIKKKYLLKCKLYLENQLTGHISISTFYIRLGKKCVKQFKITKNTFFLILTTYHLDMKPNLARINK